MIAKRLRLSVHVGAHRERDIGVAEQAATRAIGYAPADASVCGAGVPRVFEADLWKSSSRMAPCHK
jgi:hypothetical protein